MFTYLRGDIDRGRASYHCAVLWPFCVDLVIIYTCDMMCGERGGGGGEDLRNERTHTLLSILIISMICTYGVC